MSILGIHEKVTDSRSCTTTMGRLYLTLMTLLVGSVFELLSRLNHPIRHQFPFVIDLYPIDNYALAVFLFHWQPEKLGKVCRHRVIALLYTPVNLKRVSSTFNIPYQARLWLQMKAFFSVGQETLVCSMWCQSKISIEFDISSVPYSLVSSLCRALILRPVPTTSEGLEASTPRCQPWRPFSPVVRRQDRRIRGRSARVRILPPRRDFTRPSRLSLHTRVSKP